MRKLTLLATIILTVFICSCGGGSTDEKKESAETKTVAKKLVLDTKEAMMAKLQEFNVIIPDSMIFGRIEMKPYLNKKYEEDTTYMIYFSIKDLDVATKDSLYAWYDKQFSELVAKGWTEVEYRKDEEMMGGGVYSTFSLTKNSEDCELKIGISYSDNNCTVHVSPRFGNL